MAFGYATEFSFDVLSPGVGLTFRVPDAFLNRADEYAARVDTESERWLRGYAGRRALPPEILSSIGDRSLVDVEWEEGSLRVKVALSLAGLLVLLAGCRNSPHPTYREECSRALKQLAGIAKEELGSENLGESQEPEMHLGKLGEIDLAFERWNSDEIDARELGEILDLAFSELRDRNEITLLLEYAVYLNDRYQKEIERLKRESSEPEIRFTFEHRVVHEVRVRPGITDHEVIDVIRGLKDLGYTIESPKQERGVITFILSHTYEIVCGIGGFVGGLIAIRDLMARAKKRAMERLNAKATVKQGETPSTPPATT